MKNTTSVFLITLSFTLLAGLMDEFVIDADRREDSFFTAMALFGLLGSIISFFTALVAAFKVDCPVREYEELVCEEEDPPRKWSNRPGTGA